MRCWRMRCWDIWRCGAKWNKKRRDVAIELSEDMFYDIWHIFEWAGEWHTLTLSARYSGIKYYVNIYWDENWRANVEYGYEEWWSDTILDEFKNLLNIPNLSERTEEAEEMRVNGPIPSIATYKWAAEYWVWPYWYEEEDPLLVPNVYWEELLLEVLNNPGESLHKRQYQMWYLWSNEEWWDPAAPYDYFIRWEALWWTVDWIDPEDMFFQKWPERTWYVDKWTKVIPQDIINILTGSFTDWIALPKNVYKKIVELPYAPIAVTWLYIGDHSGPIYQLQWTKDQERRLTTFLSPYSRGDGQGTEATNTNVILTSTNPNVAYAVQEPYERWRYPWITIHFVEVGTATITCTTEDWWFTHQIDVTVVDNWR